jgi:hypothetical protein
MQPTPAAPQTAKGETVETITDPDSLLDVRDPDLANELATRFTRSFWIAFCIGAIPWAVAGAAVSFDGFMRGKFGLEGLILFLASVPSGAACAFFTNSISIESAVARNKAPDLEAAEEQLMDIEEESYKGNPPWMTQDTPPEVETDELTREEIGHLDEQANATDIRAKDSSVDAKPRVCENQERSARSEAPDH